MCSLSHVALHTGYTFWEEYLLRFFKTPPFKNLKAFSVELSQYFVQSNILLIRGFFNARQASQWIKSDKES